VGSEATRAWTTGGFDSKISLIRSAILQQAIVKLEFPIQFNIFKVQDFIYPPASVSLACSGICSYAASSFIKSAITLQSLLSAFRIVVLLMVLMLNI